jgi:hypothetical protein
MLTKSWSASPALVNEMFLTFDTNQKALAEAEGMVAPL